MTHDPLCVFATQPPVEETHAVSAAGCVWCRVIAAARADTMRRDQDCDNHGDEIRFRCAHYQQGVRDGDQTGYMRGLEDAETAVETMSRGWTASHDPKDGPYSLVAKGDAMDAIRALG